MVTHRLAESSISSSYVCVSKRPFIHVVRHSNPPYSVILLEVTWAIRVTFSFHTQKMESSVTPKGLKFHFSPTSSQQCSKMHFGQEFFDENFQLKLCVIKLITWCRQSLTFQIMLAFTAAAVLVANQGPTGTKPWLSLTNNYSLDWFCRGSKIFDEMLKYLCTASFGWLVSRRKNSAECPKNKCKLISLFIHI